jgi:redox-sensing transcriptional repressor
MSPHKSDVPIPVIRRLAHYLHHIQEDLEQEREWISSLDLARALDVTSSTVRQDLSCLDISGIAKRGYRVKDLQSAILTLLGRDEISNMVIIGAGNLGRALALHGEFPRQGFAVAGLFDNNPKLVGKFLEDTEVLSLDKLPEVVREHNVEIGVIAVPHQAAQEVADRLVAAGVRGVLNMSMAHVRTPPHVPVVHARMYSSLSLLSHAITARKEAELAAEAH